MTTPTANTIEHPECGFRHLDPIPSGDDVRRFYESKYFDLLRQGGRAPELRRLMEGGETARAEIAWLRSALFDDVVTALQQFHGGPKLLDVGCGNGEFLDFARSRGFETSGLEVAEAGVEAARARGLEVHAMTTEEYLASHPDVQQSLDAVVMLNVLEHVPDPIPMLRSVSKLLKPGGLLCVRVPNDFTELQAAAREKLGVPPWWIAVPDHINYFTFASLAKTYSHCGFQTVYSQSDFPLELFLLMGENYVGDAAMGSQCHQRRVQMELSMPGEVRRRLYQAFASAGIGRNVLMLGRRS